GAAPTTQIPHLGFRTTLDASGDTWTNPADGSVYHFVAGGEYSIGSEAEGASSREAPEHTISVDGFWIQETETTNAQYARCVDDGACTEPDNDRWQDPDFADYPVANVSWEQAMSYTQWLGARLPTEAEWEVACRGPDHNLYPWGEETPYVDLANYGDVVEDTMPVGSYPEGVAASGALDMAGNVWEWTSSLDMAYAYDPNDGREAADADGKRIMRGGSFYYPELFLRCSARTGAAPTTQIPHLGFRTTLDGR
ncbi:MAG: formylglycine-generating enzyme family protein, partial [Caldilineaceae bacterium]